MRAALLALVVSAAACGSSPPAPTEPAPNDTQATEPAPATDTTAAADAALRARVPDLTETLEKLRQEHHIPGMAVAVVHRGEVVLARGFGQRDLESGAEVTPETVFAIGSTTKAFTATLVAMMVADGKMSWDDPLSKYLPNLTLKVKAGSQQPAHATLRDALSHRTGFPRMGLLWGAGTLSRDEMYTHASQATPTAALREQFQYNNVVFAAAGEAAAAAAGGTWHQLLAERVLGPLGMSQAVTTKTAASTHELLARGYVWREDDGKHERENLRSADLVAPAGAIYANADDMAKWLAFLIADGRHGDRALVTPEALAETFKTQIAVAGSNGYGLGWFTRTFDGQPMLEHGGNIDGYAASVGFLPESELGYVFLCNLSSTPLQASVAQTIFGTLLSDSEAGKAGENGTAGEREDFSLYVGKYVANFGPFEDALFDVVIKDEKLAVKVPGQDTFTLTPPGEDGRRSFEVSDDIRISFELSDDDRVIAMYVHQYGFDFELPRQGVEPELQIDPAEVAPLLGAYKDPKTDTVVTVLIHRGRLAVDVPGQTKFELDPPPGGVAERDGKWPLRWRRAFFVVFNRADGGAVTGLTINQGGQNVPYQRLPKSEQPKLVTLDSVLALRKPAARRQALARGGHIVLTGTATVPSVGMSGTVTIHIDGADRYRQEVDFGKAGRITSVVSGDQAWTASSFDDPQQLSGRQLRQAQAAHPWAYVTDFTQLFDDVELIGSATRDGQEVHIVRLSAGDLPKRRVELDAATGDVLTLSGQEIHHFGTVPLAAKYADFKPVKGLPRAVRVPHKLTVEQFQSGSVELVIERVKVRQPRDPSLFPATPPADQ